MFNNCDRNTKIQKQKFFTPYLEMEGVGMILLLVSLSACNQGSWIQEEYCDV